MDMRDKHAPFASNGHADVQHMAEERTATQTKLESTVAVDPPLVDHVPTVSGTHACVREDRRCAHGAGDSPADADVDIAIAIHVSASQRIGELSPARDVLRHHASVQTIRVNGSPLLELSRVRLHGIKEATDAKAQETKDTP